MFLVLVETVDDAHPDSPNFPYDHEWDVCAHTQYGVKIVFTDKQGAVEFATRQAEKHSNNFAVAEISEIISRSTKVEVLGARGTRP